VNTPPHPDYTYPATVADLVEHWNGVREHGPLAPATAAAYLGSIARILARQGITADTRLDDLDLDALGEKFAAANPDLKPVTLANNTNNLRSAISGYHARHRPTPASATPFTPPPTPAAPSPEPAHCDTPASAPTTAPQAAVDGTLATLPAFLAFAGKQGLLERRTAQVYAATAHGILATQPDLAPCQVADLDLAAVTATFAAHHPAVTDSVLEAQHAQLTHAVTAYLTHLHDPAIPNPPATAQPAPSPGPGLPAQVHLPRGRVVSLSAPPDLTDAEARAAAAVLYLHHPEMFTPDQPGTAPTPPPGESTPGRWTLVFWPEENPDEPESACITGSTFRAALADYTRTRDPHRAHLTDEDAINAWFSTEVFFVRVIDGHHQAHDAGTLL
jgi:hypothetical protein